MELSGPGVQYIADNQLYNSIITAHAILMIFFMVEKKINIFNLKVEYTQITELCVQKVNNLDNYLYMITSDDNNNEILIEKALYKKDLNLESNLSAPFSYDKIIVKDPFNNRNIIFKVAKKQKGVYVWESLDKHMYVGHSINLYNRISSYFMPSILKTKARRVLRHFNKHGFNNTKLTIYIIDENSSLEQVVKLEQYFIDTLKPNFECRFSCK